MKTRLQIDLDELTREQIEQLGEQLGGLTKKAVFEYALEALQWVVDQHVAGRTVASIEGDKYFELVMPKLRRLKL